MPARVMEVVVRGGLAPSLVAALDGFTIDTAGSGLTSITGPVTDQAMLFGLLGMLDEVHIEVVSVNPRQDA